MDHEDLPENLIITDHNGIPDHAINPQQITEDGFALACRVGASRGDQDTITTAISRVLTAWGDHAGYVLASGLTHLGRDLVPLAADMAKEAVGVDWAAHCAAMLEPDYDPETVDAPSTRPQQQPAGTPTEDEPASQMRDSEPAVPTIGDMEDIVSANYLERVADHADHIQECAEFLAEHVSKGGEYDLDDADGIQFARDLIHTIDTDTQKMRLLMLSASRSQPTSEEPSYVRMESRLMTPAETDEHMRQTLTPDEYAEWSRPPTPQEQAEADQIDAEAAADPNSFVHKTVKHMRGTRVDPRRAPASVTRLRPQSTAEDFTPMEIPASVRAAVREALGSSAAVEAARLYGESYRQGFDAITQGAEFGPDRADIEDQVGYDHGARDARAAVWIDTGQHPPEPAA